MLRCFVRSLRGFVKNEDGPTAVEYAVMLALIVVVCISTITALGGNASNVFNSVANAEGNAGSGGGSGGSGSDSVAVGGSASSGTSESSGVFTMSADGYDYSYNAGTGDVTVTGQGQTITGNVGAGVLPGVGLTWTRTQ